MTPLEQDALICLHYQMYCPLDEMARYVVGEWELAQHFNNSVTVETADTYRAILEGMIANGWLRVVREPRNKRLAHWQALGWLTPPEDELPEKGDLDFTPLGWRLYQNKATVEDRLVWVDEKTQTLNCVARSAKECQAWLTWASDPFSHGLFDHRTTYPVQLVRIADPVRIGPWFPREQQRNRAGWKLSVHFRRVRRRRVQIPELDLSGWLEPWEQLRIEGKVSGRHFSLGQSVSQTFGGQFLYTPNLWIYIKRDSFRWESPNEFPEPLTPEQAIAALRQGIEAWQSTKGLGPPGKSTEVEIQRRDVVAQRDDVVDEKARQERFETNGDRGEEDSPWQRRPEFGGGLA